MNAAQINWDEDLRLSPEESYEALVHSLERTKGFNLLFVRCSPAEGDRIIEKVQSDLPKKTIEVISLKEPIDNLYDRVAALPNLEQINVLFIKGVEYSIYEYEDTEYGDINLRSRSEVYGGTWKRVPRLFGHLNLSRERFRDNFNICFVFLVPEFVLRYFIRRAPDFFDWHSNVFDFPSNPEQIEQAILNILKELREGQYKDLSNCDLTSKILEIRAWTGEKCRTSNNNANLLFGQGLIGLVREKYEEAIASFDKALEIEPDNANVWVSRGDALKCLGKYEEAIANFSKAIQIKIEDLFASNDKALQIEPDTQRGIILVFGDKYEEAIASFDKALQIEPDNAGVWILRGFVLRYLDRYEEAIASYDRALTIKPDDPIPLYSKACVYALQDKIEQAIKNLQQAIQLSSEEYRNLARTKPDFDRIRSDPRFQALISEPSRS